MAKVCKKGGGSWGVGGRETSTREKARNVKRGKKK